MNVYYGSSPYGMGDDYMEPTVPEGTQAFAGSTIEKGIDFASQEEVEEALRTVFDPEIPVNIYDLGLIYECEMHHDGNISIVMTLTAPACPVAGEMPGQVAEAVALLEGVGQVTVTLTWQPQWTPDMMSEDAKLALGF